MINDNIEFETIDFGKDIIRWFSENDVFNDVTIRVLGDATEKGCFLAGGFPSMFAKICIQNDLAGPGSTAGPSFNNDHIHEYKKSKTELIATLQNYVGFTSKASYELGLLRGTKSSDVDVWFPNLSVMANIRKELTPAGVDAGLLSITNEQRLDVFSSPCAINVVCMTDRPRSSQMLQFVTRLVGSPEDVLSTFDLTNSMVAIVGSKLIFPTTLRDLVKKNTMNVQNYNSYATLKRISNYAFKQSYNNITKETCDMINDNLDGIVDDIIKIPGNNIGNNISYKLKALFDKKNVLTLENIVYISAFLKNDSYSDSFNFGEALKRAQELREGCIRWS